MEQFKRDSFTSEGRFKIEEASGIVDGVTILAKVSGPFFVPEGTSRNKRFYSKALWEKCLARPDVQSKLSEKRMFGTIGHDEPIDDKALRDGKLSHIMTGLAVEKDGVQGYGECLIVNTPAGQILNTFLRAGAKLYTSSRALGKFVGKNDDDIPIVDENSYELQTFDFVLDPGFLQANPQLAESYKKFEETFKQVNETLPIKIKKGENNMDQLLEKSMNEAASLRSELSGAAKENATLKTQNEALQKEVVESGKTVTGLDEYKKLGSVEQLKEQTRKLGVCETELAKYKLLGSAGDVEKALAGAKKFIKEYVDLGTPAEVKESLEKAAKLLNEYKPLGSPSVIDRVLEKFKSMAVSMNKTIENKKVTDLAKELGVSEATVRRFWGTMKVEDIKATVAELKESVAPVAPSVTRYKKTTAPAAPGAGESGNPPATQSEAPWVRESLGDRLNGHFAKNT